MIDLESAETAAMLRRVAAEGPDPSHVARSAITAASSRQRTRSRRGITLPIGLPSAAVLALLGAWALLYFVPVTESTALAGEPAGIQPRWLDNLGLDPTDLTLSGATIRSAGVTVRLDGLYADATRTVIVTHSSGGLIDPSSVAIDDQFFHHYTVLDAVSNSDTGLQTMTFPPFESPAGITGARVHFEATRTSGAQPVTGRWAVDAVVVPRPGRPLSVSGGSVGGRKLTFTSVVRSGASVSMAIRLDGPPIGPDSSVAGGAKPKPNILVDMNGASGVVQPATLSVNVSDSASYVNVLWIGVKPGSYQVEVTVSGATFTTSLQVGA